MNRSIFITGGSGYVGSRLIPELLDKGYTVKALVRKGSEQRIDKRCEIVFGDALNANSYSKWVSGCDTFIHLVGVHHPSPRNKKEFYSIDLASIIEAAKAASANHVQHFIYLSVVQVPFKFMLDYQAVRLTGEELIRSSEMNGTFIRPIYIIGPGHYWPLLFSPLLWLLKLFPATRKIVLLFEFVTIKQIIKSFIKAVENPPQGIRIIEIEEINKI